MDEIDQQGRNLNIDYHELVDIFNGSDHLVLQPVRHLRPLEENVRQNNECQQIYGEPLQVPLNIHGDLHLEIAPEPKPLKKEELKTEILKKAETNPKKERLNKIITQIVEEKQKEDKKTVENKKPEVKNSSNENKTINIAKPEKNTNLVANDSEAKQLIQKATKVNIKVLPKINKPEVKLSPKPKPKIKPIPKMVPLPKPKPQPQAQPSAISSLLSVAASAEDDFE
jgi:hypothetical protein